LRQPAESPVCLVADQGFLYFGPALPEEDLAVKTRIQPSSNLAHIAELIEDIPVAMLTTRDDDGFLVSRPMGALEMDSTGAILFFTDLRSTKAGQLAPCNLTFVDRDKGTYVSLSGMGEIDTSRELIKQLWSPMAEPWFPDGMDSPDLAVLKVKLESAAYWDAPDSKMVRMLAAAASIARRKPVGMGEHGVVTKL